METMETIDKFSALCHDTNVIIFDGFGYEHGFGYG